jgi:hypothetical protein
MQICQASLEASRAVETNSPAGDELKKLDQDFAKIDTLHSNVLERFAFGRVGGIFHNSLLKAADIEMETRMVVAAIALKRYQLREGKYPAQLQDLVPTCASEVPRDFMDGKPLRYHTDTDGTFVLYSIGEDGEDNGGDTTPPKDGGTKSWWKARDAVWPMPASAEETKSYLDKALSDWKKNQPVSPRKK